MVMVDKRKVIWMLVWVMSVLVLYRLVLMKVLSRWIDEILMMVVVSLIFRIEVFICESYLGWLGWFFRFMCEMKVLYLFIIIMISRLEIIIMLIKVNIISMMVCLLSFLGWVVLGMVIVFRMWFSELVLFMVVLIRFISLI